MALGGLSAGWLVTATGDTVAVLAVTADVAAGERLERADLAGLAGEEGDGQDGEEEGPVPKYPRSLLRFQLTDGSTVLEAIEYRRIHNISNSA